MERTLHLWVENKNRKHILIDRNVLHVPEMRDTKPFPESKGWLHRLGNRFGLKNIKITEECCYNCSILLFVIIVNLCV